MIIENNKPIKVIGYPESSMVESAINFVSLETQNTMEVITPEVFMSLENKFHYQYLVAFCIDTKLRIEICKEIDNLDLDCITYIHDTTLLMDTCTLGKGVFAGPFNALLYSSNIGNHCWFDSHCLVAHHVNLGRACVLHSGVLIAGKTIIGENCTFKFKSSVLNHLNITDNVTIGAHSNVTKNIDRPGRYLGSIARYIGER